MMSPYPVLGALVIAASGIAVTDVRADAIYDEVAELMRVGWSTSFKTRAAADEQFGKVKAVAAGKLDAYYAYTLVLIKQRRYPQAASAIDELARADSSNVYYLRTKAWLNALMKEYSTSLLTLDQLGQSVAELDAEDDQLLRREMTGFLGRMVGFLDGPAGDSSTGGTVAATKSRIAGRLSPEEQSLFNDEAQSVVARYQEMIAESEEEERDAKADAEEQRDQLLVDLERQRERMDQRRKELGPARGKLRDEAKAEYDQYAKEDLPLQQQLAQLEQQAAVVRNELIFLSSDLTRLLSSIDRSKDPTARAALINESNRLSFLARRYDTELLALERRAASINAARAEIAGRARQSQQRFAAELSQIDTELAEIEKQERRNDLDQRKSQRSRVTGKTRLTRAIAAKATGLTTYEDFSLEAEKDRVLNALK